MKKCVEKCFEKKQYILETPTVMMRARNARNSFSSRFVISSKRIEG